ncbi:MAG: efflux RND transporter permease subunit [Lysobacterales bacterium]
MNIVRLATERRVTIAMVTIALVLFGLIGLSRLKVNLLPDLSYPTLTVRTEYVGAAPAEIENLITEPLEEALGVVKSLKRIRSVSRTGQSDVILEFTWGTNMDDAGMDVREKLELIQLPLDVKKPLLLRFDPSTEPVMRLALATGTNDSNASSVAALTELRRYAEEDLKKRLEPIEGVAAVKVSGGLEDEIQVEIDQNRLKQLNLDVNTVIERLRQENINISSGRLDEASQRYLVRTINQFSTLADMGDMVVAVSADVPVKLRDVATVSQGYKERQAIIRSDGQEAVEVAIYKEGDANTVSVAEAVVKALERYKDELPEGAKLTTVDDQSIFIKSSIREVVDAAVIGGLLSILVIFLFLGEAWATLVIALSLPVSIIATFFFMQQFGIGLNVMSLGGIALATGMVVDNAIVVLENTRRLRDQGLGVVEAAVQGTSEVGMAITASTFTHIAVFLPLVFVEGIAGQLFGDQALTVTFAMIISLFVAVTLIPMLASLGSKHSAMEFEHPQPAAHQRHWLMSNRPRLDHGRFLLLPVWLLLALLRGVWFVIAKAAFALAWLIRRIFGGLGGVAMRILSPMAKVTMGFFDFMLRRYDVLLPWSLRHPAVILGVALLSLLGAVALVPRLGVELIPEFAQGRLQVDLKLPVGTPLARTDLMVTGLQQHGMQVTGIEHMFATAGTGARLDANPTESGENVGKLLVTLAPHTERSDEPAIVEALRAYTDVIPGADAKFSRPQLFSFETPLEVEISGYDLDLLKQASERISARMRKEAMFADVKNSQEQGAPEVRIYFDQDKIASLGLTTRQVADQVVRKVRGEVATRYSFRDRKIDVLVRATEPDRDSVEAVRRLIVNPGSSSPVPLDSVARVEITEGPAEIRRINQERVAIVSASLRGDLGSAVALAQQIVDENLLPAGTAARVAGQSEDLDASFNSLMLALALAVFMVYLVMASQFESLLHPFLILFTIPLALVGAIFSLWITGTTLSIIVFIGLIMLVGIVVSNAIVLIDRVNQLRARGMEKRAALMEGARTRLRPIIMTTITTLFGFLPMALGLGDGAELRQPLAITVIGGLVFSTLLTLLVIPVLYNVVDRRATYRQPRALQQGEGAEVGV